MPRISSSQGPAILIDQYALGSLRPAVNSEIHPSPPCRYLVFTALYSIESNALITCHTENASADFEALPAIFSRAL